MIPDFNERGYLPPGIHRALLTEIEERFGRATEIRRAQMQSLDWLVDLAKRAGIERLIINGSFVTDVFEPNDVDCVLLMGASFPRERSAVSELCAGLPFVHMQIVSSKRFKFFVNTFFAADSRGSSERRD